MQLRMQICYMITLLQLHDHRSNTNINTNSKYGNAFGNGALKFFCLIKSTGCPDNLLFGRTYVRVAGKNYFEHCKPI